MRFGVQRGFNLIELVIVLVVLGIVVVAISPVLSKPFQAYEDLSRRTALVDAAQSALSQMANDVRDAIPNTLRTNGANALEFMPIRLGGRYRYDPLPTNNAGLTPSAPDSAFQALGNIAALPSGARVVVFNTGATQFYNAAINGSGGIISPLSTTVSVSGGNQINLSSAYQFDASGNGSPGRRFYIANTPISYVCDLTNNQLLRIEGYNIAVAQPTNPAASPLSGAPSQAVVSEYVTACNFNYIAGTNTRSGVLVLSMTLTLEGEIIELLQQIHVSNVP